MGDEDLPDTRDEQEKTVHALLECEICIDGLNSHGNEAPSEDPENYDTHTLCLDCGRAFWGNCNSCISCGSEEIDVVKGWNLSHPLR